MVNLTYILKESLSGFRKAKLAAFASISTIAISMLLIGGFSLISFNTSKVVELIRSRVEMEAFLDEPLSQSRINEIKMSILAIEGVDSVRFISKEEAAKIFKEEFGEEVEKVLNFNPLPPSYKIYLNKNYKNTVSANVIFKKIKSISGIDDVVFRKDIIEFLDKRTDTLKRIGLIFGIIIGISAVFLVSNTIRLTIYSKRRIIQTMKLVGATKWFIRLPFLIDGMLQGILGGLIASAILYFLTKFISNFISQELTYFVSLNEFFYFMIVLIGTTLGLLGSIISVNRFISETIS